jgi:hypothetical protein
VASREKKDFGGKSFVSLVFQAKSEKGEPSGVTIRIHYQKLDTIRKRQKRGKGGKRELEAGRPDCANFRLLGDGLHWAVL